MTITLAPQTESRLRRKAARMGEDADRLIEALLRDALADEALAEASEEELREEYRRLVAQEMRGNLPDSHAARLRQVTQDLDDLDMHSPAAQAMSARLDETGRKLDEMLALLRGLPMAEQAP